MDSALHATVLVVFFSVIGCNVGSSDGGHLETSDHRGRVNEQRIVTFTSKALRKVRESQVVDGGKYIRVDVLPGFVYYIRFEDTMDNTVDILNEQSGIKILVSKTAQPYLLGSTIDWQVDSAGREGFHFENPNALPNSEAANLAK